MNVVCNKRQAVQCATAALILLLSLLCVHRRPASAAEEDLASIVRAIADGYRANVSAFRHLKVRAVLIQGGASSFDDALARRFIPKSTIRTEGEYVASGALQRVNVSVGDDSTLWIADEAHQVVIFDINSGGHHQTTVQPGRLEGQAYLIVPFHLGLAGRYNDRQLDVLLEEALSDPGVNAVYEGKELLDSFQCWKVLLKYEHGRAIRLWVVPSQGMLVIRREHILENQVVAVARCLRARECSQGRWLPEHVVFATTSGATDGAAVVVRETEFSEIDADTPPVPDKFKLVLPVGVMVADRFKGPWRTSDVGREIKLEEYLNSADKYAGVPVSESPDGRTETSERRYLLIASSVVCFISFVVLVLVRRRKPAV